MAKNQSVSGALSKMLHAGNGHRPTSDGSSAEPVRIRVIFPVSDRKRVRESV
jgi:hypothetical protein